MAAGSWYALSYSGAWSQVAVVMCVYMSACVLTLCHSLTGGSVKSVGTCLFLVGQDRVGGEVCIFVHVCFCVDSCL